MVGLVLAGYYGGWPCRRAVKPSPDAPEIVIYTCLGSELIFLGLFYSEINARFFPSRVYVNGAVQYPGTYSLPSGYRVDDAIQAAGGTTARAATSRLNLAARLDDGEQAQVPEKIRQGQGPDSSSGDAVFGSPTPGTPSGGLVNINTVTLEELDTLPGIGPATAQKIIDYRDASGPFQTLEEIMNVPGIGPATFEPIKDLITL